MTEAVLTSEKAEELANENALGAITFPLTILARFAKYFLMGHRPRHAGDRYTQYQEPDDLKSQSHNLLVVLRHGAVLQQQTAYPQTCPYFNRLAAAYVPRPASNSWRRNAAAVTSSVAIL